MTPDEPPPGTLIVHDLLLEVEEAKNTLAALRSGEVDALLVADGSKQQVFLLQGADQAYRVIFEALYEGAMTISPDATILYANGRLAELLDLPLERVLGAGLDRFVAPEDAPAFRRLVAAVTQGGQKGEMTLVSASGRAVPVMMAASVVEEDVYAVVVTDLTAQKAAEEALREANDALEARVLARTDELERANAALREEFARSERLGAELRRQADELADAGRRKDEFLSMLAHELRNPLAPILAAAEMTRMHAEAHPALARYGSTIARQAQTLARLLDDLLDVSRITRGVVTLRKEIVELADVVWSAVESSRPRMDTGGHALTVRVPAEPVRLFVDPTRFEQVLVNLLNNAAKYTDKGGRISLAAERDGAVAIVRVRDNGVGIAKDLLPRVFDLFVQGERALDRAQGGLGIGLTLVKNLVEMHGGTVEMLSEGTGRGSEVIVRLPLAPGEEADKAESKPPQSLGVPNRRRVLVVEDNPDTANLLSEMLEMWGHEAWKAYDAHHALELAKAQKPDVAIVDIGLPGVDGYEVARRLRGAAPPGKELVLIAVTGYAQERDREAARSAGFDHHMVKPADTEALRRLLGTAKPEAR